jgi:hypothetical protein
MSLINKQLLGQAEQERYTLMRTIAMGDNSQRNRDALNRCNNQIKKYQKLVNQDEAAFKAKHPPQIEVQVEEVVNVPPKEREPLPEDILLQCKDCGDDFNFSGKDQVFFTRKSFPPPVRCSVCREERENNKPKPITLSCRVCSQDFEFTVKQQFNFKRNNWPEPKTCPPCCEAKRSKASTTNTANH